jgi:uncharacterized membrane protein (TIGR02234 family)
MRAASALLLLVGAVTALVGTGRTWADARVLDPVLGVLLVPVTGSEVSPTAGAAALLALAAVVAGLLTRGAVRAVALTLAGVSGLWLVWSGVRAVVDPASGVQEAVLSTAGSSAQAVEGAAATPWPWVVVVAGAALLAGAVLSLVDRRRAPRGRTSADTSTPPAGSVRPEEQARRDASAAWDDLSAGRDPTEDDSAG